MSSAGGGQAFGLNDQVTQELLQHQMAGGGNNGFGGNRQPGGFAGGSNNRFKGGQPLSSQQREFEEAMELDRMLEAERREVSMRAFA